MTAGQYVHRRSRRPQNTTFDAYNSLATKYPPSGSHKGAINEFWSNGSVTHLTIYDTVHSSLHRSPTYYSEKSFDAVSSTCDQYPVAMSPNRGQSQGISTPAPARRRTQPKENYVAFKSIVAGSVSGVASTILFHPLDVLRTKMQAASFPVSEASASAAVSSSASSGSVASIRSGGGGGAMGNPAGPSAVFMHTIRNGGISALYTGIKPVLLAQAGYKATVFTVNNLTRRFLIDWKTREQHKTGTFRPYEPSLADTFLCGGVGGFINAALFVAPVEFVRNQQIHSHSRLSTREGFSSEAMASKMKRPTDIIKKTLRKHGPYGLWRGTGLTVTRDFLGCGAFFVMFEVGKEKLAPVLGGRDSLTTLLTAGALAGWGYWAFALPLDTLKTLIQTGNATSAWDTVMLSVERDGAVTTMKQLFRGWQLAFGRGAPAAAVTLSSYTAVYEMCTRFVG